MKKSGENYKLHLDIDIVRTIRQFRQIILKIVKGRLKNMNIFPDKCYSRLKIQNLSVRCFNLVVYYLFGYSEPPMFHFNKI